jgi:hypothetical protein
VGKKQKNAKCIIIYVFFIYTIYYIYYILFFFNSLYVFIYDAYMYATCIRVRVRSDEKVNGFCDYSRQLVTIYTTTDVNTHWTLYIAVCYNHKNQRSVPLNLIVDFLNGSG